MPPNALLRLFWITLSSAVLGAIFAHLEIGTAGGRADIVYLQGGLNGLLIGGSLSTLEIIVLNGPLDARLRTVPFLLFLGLRSLVYLGIILLVLSATSWLVPTASGKYVGIRRPEIVFSVALSLGYNLFFGVNQLLGPGVLFAFVAGRYHRPRLEERVLLFIDMRSSTAIAERLGETRYLDFLNRFLADVSLAIAACGGEIHKYVGDEIIATWTLPAGPGQSGCIRACFAALDRLAASASAYERDFGCRADFRAGLHCGTVVVGELGYLKKEIALIGDTMNTAARIQQACRETGHRVLASAALLERIADLPTGITRRALGPLPLRGKEHALALYALEAAGAT